MNEEVQQKAEWRSRLISVVIERKHDDETLCHLLEAGLHQAHSEGLQDAVYVLEEVSKQRPNHAAVFSILAEKLKKLDRMNAA